MVKQTLKVSGSYIYIYIHTYVHRHPQMRDLCVCVCVNFLSTWEKRVTPTVIIGRRPGNVPAIKFVTSCSYKLCMVISCDIVAVHA